MAGGSEPHPRMRWHEWMGIDKWHLIHRSRKPTEKRCGRNGGMMCTEFRGKNILNSARGTSGIHSSPLSLRPLRLHSNHNQIWQQIGNQCEELENRGG
jgi:hypothetical protein